MRQLIAIAVLTITSKSLAADFATKGPVATTTSALPAGFAGATGGKLVVPTPPGKYPLVIASHGWSASSANQLGWAEHFASYGLVVVVPDFPSPFMPDAAKNRDIIKAIVEKIATATDKADVTRLALEGHSAGGLATTLAAASLKPRATVLFDPVDNGDVGKAAHATLCAPVLSIFANASSCNNSAAWFAFRSDVKGPLVSFRVKGSTHCDGENADRGVACGSFCGGAADKGRQSYYAKYATAFLLRELKGDADAAALIPAAASDTALEAHVVKDAPSCGDTGPSDAAPSDASPGDASTSDASTTDGSTTDASTSDASTPSDAAVTDDAGATADATANADDANADAAGCTCSTPTRTTSGSGALLLALFMLRRRR